MSKRREPLGLRSRVPLKKEMPIKEETPKVEETLPLQAPVSTKNVVKTPIPTPKPQVEAVDDAIVENTPVTPAPVVKSEKPKPKPKGRPSTKKGKKLTKYSMDIHPELKRAVVKAAAIYDKEVHVMWNEIVFEWFNKESKKNPGWYKSIKIDKSEL